ncbi:hypothetical protein B0J14DRAFT_145325 [Halenospora varia]|nr:hypothetical protein B0J14DRAFT_145325 [Halenospora varia]
MNSIEKMAALSSKCEAVFAELPRLQLQLRNNSHGTDLFDIETGIEHFTTSEMGGQISEAIRDFIAANSESDAGRKKTESVEHTINICAKAIRACKRHVDQAIIAKENREDHETKALQTWTKFSFGITSLSLLVPMKRIEVLGLLGGMGTTTTQPTFPDSVSEAGGTRRTSALVKDMQFTFPTVTHSGGPGSGFSMESFVKRARARAQDRDTSDTLRAPSPHGRARSDFGPRKFDRGSQVAASSHGIPPPVPRVRSEFLIGKKSSIFFKPQSAVRHHPAFANITLADIS